MSLADLRARLANAPERTTILARYGKLNLATYRTVPATLAKGNPRVDWPAVVAAGDVPVGQIAGRGGAFWTADLARAAWAANPAAASLNPDLPWDRLFDEVATASAPWGRLAANPGVPWTEARVRRHLEWLQAEDDDWHPDMAYEAPRYLNRDVRQCATPLEHLAQNPGLRWSAGLVEGIAWDWAWLSRNRGLPWSLTWMQAHRERLDGTGVGGNPAVPFSLELAAAFADRLDWAALSSNPGSFWTRPLLAAWRPRLDAGGLAQNPALPWDESLILDLGASVHGRLVQSNPGVRWTAPAVARLGADVAKISDRSGWTLEALQELAPRLPWRSLSASRCLPWSEALIAMFAARWDWELLAANPSLPWTEALLGAYADRWSLAGLARNEVAGPRVADLLTP